MLRAVVDWNDFEAHAPPPQAVPHRSAFPARPRSASARLPMTYINEDKIAVRRCLSHQTTVIQLVHQTIMDRVLGFKQ
jgi:hypothetical protein